MTAFASPVRRFFALDLASRAAALSFGSNAMLMLVKISIGLAFGSVAVLGDGVDSAEDVVASAIAFFTVRLAMQPADEAHPYGHGKAESLAAMSQGALIAGGAVFIAATAIYRLTAGSVDIYVLPSLVAMGVTVAVNVGVAAYSLRAARVSGSVAIAADARHLMTNVVQAAGVIAALALVGVTGSHVFDPVVALLLAAYLLWMAFGILRVSLRELIDSALPPEDVARLAECLAHEAQPRPGGQGPRGIRGYHALRTRKSGREKYIELHVVVDPALTVSEAHRSIEEIETHIRELIDGAVVSIHIDPDEPGIMERNPAPERAAAGERLHLH